MCREGEAGTKTLPTTTMRTRGTAVVKQCGHMTFCLMTLSSGVENSGPNSGCLSEDYLIEGIVFLFGIITIHSTARD